MSRNIRRILVAVCVLLCASDCMAQLELSTGLDLNYPILLNSNNSMLNYGQITFGIRAGVAYKPENTQFFPILNLSFGRTRLPLKQIGEDVAALNFDYLNVMLNENYVAHFTNSELYIYGGVGFSYLIRKGITVAGKDGETMHASIDSTANISSVFPAINIGFEYNYGESAGKPLYITMGINFQYILLLADRNTYKFGIDQRTGLNYYTANLTGNMISPGFYLSLHYLLSLHKKGGMYL